MHVLIVEGDDQAAEAISRKLRKLGHTSVAVRTLAEAALEAAPLKTPPSPTVDIVIVNANLPDGGAAKLMPMLAELGIRGIAIVRAKGEWDAMRAAGFTFHIPAPVTLRDLRAVFVPIEAEPRPEPRPKRGRESSPFLQGAAKSASKAKGKRGNA